MLRYRFLSLVTLLMLGLGSQGVTAATPVASPMATPVAMACEEVREYMQGIDTLQLEASEGLEDPLSRDPAKLQPDQQRAIADMLDELAIEIDAMDEQDIPTGVEEYHQAMIDALELMADAYSALASSQPVTYYLLTEDVEAALDRVGAARDGIEAACG